MEIEKAEKGTMCNCDSPQSHRCVLITDRSVSVDDVVAFALANNAACDDMIIMRFPSCCQDLVSEEGLVGALSG